MEKELKLVRTSITYAACDNKVEALVQMLESSIEAFKPNDAKSFIDGIRSTVIIFGSYGSSGCIYFGAEPWKYTLDDLDESIKIHSTKQT